MEVANILDIDGTQWEMQDLTARNDIANMNTKLSQITKNVFIGTATFDVFMTYLGEDNNYIHYNFWWAPTNMEINNPVTGINVIPIDSVKDKIINLNLNILQAKNPNIIQATQHSAGDNDAGILTYIKNASSEKHWIISGMGILRRVK